MSTEFRQLDEITVDVAAGSVYESGWQSWSPSAVYSVSETSARPVDPYFQFSYRPETPSPSRGFQGEGLLAVESAPGAGIHVFSAENGRVSVPSIRAELRDTRLLISSNHEVNHVFYPGLSMHEALAADADAYRARHNARAVRSVPPIWASWYQYFTAFTQADLEENLDAMEDLELPVGIVRLDDAFQAGIGDWLDASDQFGSLDRMVGSVLERSREAGIWLAPFLIGAKSRLFSEHPDWAVVDDSGAPVRALFNWGQWCYAIDTTHPAALEYLRAVFTTYREWGVTYFMVDFVYAAALPGRRFDNVSGIEAYTRAMALVRETIGEDSYLQGCGAPIYPSIGFVDTMRVGADVAPTYAPEWDEPAAPGGESSLISTTGRAFMHGRYWVNDPDCFVVRPGIENRELLADVVQNYGGARISSDGLRNLDDWGLQRTRELLRPAQSTPFSTDLPLSTPLSRQALVGTDLGERPGALALERFLIENGAK